MHLKRLRRAETQCSPPAENKLRIELSTRRTPNSCLDRFATARVIAPLRVAPSRLRSQFFARKGENDENQNDEATRESESHFFVFSDRRGFDIPRRQPGIGLFYEPRSADLGPLAAGENDRSPCAQGSANPCGVGRSGARRSPGTVRRG